VGAAAFSIKQQVRLVRETQGVPARSEGIVIGFYARENQTVVVRFADETLTVQPDEIEAIEPAPSSSG
jgi:hypothetical protein